MRQLKITHRITNRDTADQFITDIAQYAPVSPEEEVILAHRIKKGDDKAKEQLVKANLRFVISVAKQYQFQGLSLGDLINEGSIGLIKAAEKFDETKGFKFISYAVWWIRQSILCAIRDYGRTVRLPHNQINLSYKIHTTIAAYTQKYNYPPTEEEIANILHVQVSVIRDVMYAHNKTASFDNTENDNNTLESVLAITDKESISESFIYDLNRVLDSLNCKPKAREILLCYFGIGSEPMTYPEIATKYNLSNERVRQIVVDLLAKLKNHSAILAKYL